MIIRYRTDRAETDGTRYTKRDDREVFIVREKIKT